MDDLRRAYAVLRIEPGTSARRVKRRYRDLARAWHPDKYATDPQSQSEAAARMRRINWAYATVVQHIGAEGRPSASQETTQARRLSQEEIDSIVAAMGSGGQLDRFLDTIAPETYVDRNALLIFLGALLVTPAGAAAIFYFGLSAGTVVGIIFLSGLLVAVVRPRWFRFQ